MSKERKLIEDFPVTRPTPLSLAISAMVAAPAASAVAQEQQDSSENIMLEEVTVTARKRAEDLQSVPQSIQAISEQTIINAGLRGMDDYETWRDQAASKFRDDVSVGLCQRQVDSLMRLDLPAGVEVEIKT